jgi:hypothetical protein
MIAHTETGPKREERQSTVAIRLRRHPAAGLSQEQRPTILHAFMVFGAIFRREAFLNINERQIAGKK